MESIARAMNAAKSSSASYCAAAAAAAASAAAAATASASEPNVFACCWLPLAEFDGAVVLFSSARPPKLPLGGRLAKEKDASVLLAAVVVAPPPLPPAPQYFVFS